MGSLLTIAKYIEYFRQLANHHTEIESFVHGPSRRIIEMNRSKIKYPALWLETPDMDLWDNGADWLSGTRQGAFLVLQYAKKDDYEEQDDAWLATESIVQDILSRMLLEREQGKFDFDLNTCRMNAVSTLHVNTEYGWRVEFDIKPGIHIKFDQNKWSDHGNS